MRLQRTKLFSFSCVHASFDDENVLHLSIPFSYKGLNGSKIFKLSINESLECAFEAKAGYLSSEKIDIHIEQIIRYSRYCDGARERITALWSFVFGAPFDEFSKRNCDYLGLLFACINRPILTDFSNDPATLVALYDIQLTRPEKLKNTTALKRTEIIRQALLMWKHENSDSVGDFFDISQIRKSQYRFIQRLQFENIRYGRNSHAFDNPVVVDLLAILSHPKLNTVFDKPSMIDVRHLSALSDYLQVPYVHLLKLEVNDMIEVGSKAKWAHLIEDICHMLVDINVSPKYRLKEINQLSDIKRLHDKLVAELNRINAAERLFDGNQAMLDVSFPSPPIEPDDGIRWLSTPTDLINEGAIMSHCIGNTHYCEKAQKGETAYYHIQIGEEHATLELCLRSFRVIQLQGERNSVPSAAMVKKVHYWLTNLL